MHKHCKPGIALIQLVIGIAILVIVGTQVAPNLFRRVPLYQRKQFASLLNSAANELWIRSLETGNPHKVIFNIENRTITVEEKTKDEDDDGNALFKKIITSSFGEKYEWSDQFEVRSFFVEGVDELSQHSASSTIGDVWFFIIPNGMAQEVVINMIDRKDINNDSEGKEMSLVLNPFRVQFDVYEEFITPLT